MTPRARLGRMLNGGLHRLMAEDDAVFVLGEDVLDPYGGAFKITAGLSTAYPSRVFGTPISEAAIVGLANGLALTGEKAIVEIMFGDFMTLAFDQIVNMSSKLVSMYGRTLPVHLVVRCPVGAGRGYGATHSQSPQRHFLGVPDLHLFELSPVHDPAEQLATAIGLGRPSVLFEPKDLYGRHPLVPGAGSGIGVSGPFGRSQWMRLLVGAGEGAAADVTVFCTGGTLTRSLEAARALAATGVAVQLFVPSRLFPFDLEPIVGFVAPGSLVSVVDDGPGPAGWASAVAAQLATYLWGTIRRAPVLLSSAASVIPAARALESQVVISAADIETRLARELETS
ncbi:transketolase C-terminal domain-containing protein [Streptomyces sp. NPDC031705]|uniref:alpha-ketoacid dehydrogenase subunit beta n=1 Tax=Streptomyces sp. NPDC031705 TaxID=3155729 RepID=UPI0033E10101